ncbi:MAG: MATE family efflux transporter [Clostridia bacterium]|nr:MATE family efflux transporter [Clostridia bacterium]
MARNTMDLTRGGVAKKLIIFALPILFSNLLQQLYHAADIYVVGNFAGTVSECKTALAAVGSTGTVTTLLINLFLGLSVGTNVICANLFGSGDRKRLGKAVDTSLIIATVCGVFIAAVGYVLSEPILIAMGVPENVLPHAVTYMKIIFIGQPASLLYNFGSGILRAQGDTRRPMYILTAAGIVNVILNLFFVIVFDMDSAGVAWATTASHYFSAAAILLILCHPAAESPVALLHLHFDRSILKEILRVGIPSGLNGIVFSVSNIVITKALNTLGETVIAGNAAAANVDAFTYQILVAFYTACISFAGQNYGARKFKRIDRLLVASCLVTSAIYLVVFVAIVLFPEFFVGIFIQDPEVIAAGIPRLYVIGGGYFIYILSDMCIGCMRGMGKSVIPTVTNMVFVCVPRLIWVTFFFPMNPSLGFLYLCYPISYAISSVVQLISYLCYSRIEKRRYAADLMRAEASKQGAENS